MVVEKMIYWGRKHHFSFASFIVNSRDQSSIWRTHGFCPFPCFASMFTHKLTLYLHLAHTIHGLFSLLSTTYQFSFFACNYSIPQFNSARYQIYPHNNILHGVVILLVVCVCVCVYIYIVLLHCLKSHCYTCKVMLLLGVLWVSNNQWSNKMTSINLNYNIM